MKKLMMLVSCVVIAMGVNASQVDWKFTAPSTYNGCKVYVANGNSYSTLEALAADGLGTSGNSGTIGKTGALYYTTGSSIMVADGSYKFYFVLVSADSSQYWVSAQQTGTAYTLPTPKTTTSLVASTTTLSSGWTSFSAVPEPASVGLLLLGLCALGLKRKVA